MKNSTKDTRDRWVSHTADVLTVAAVSYALVTAPTALAWLIIAALVTVWHLVSKLATFGTED
jgi:hypothetical protein